jgi:heptosyltransferase-1
LQTKSNFRLLVVRLGAMGDILHALPAITALRHTHPDWRIDWVVEPRWQALLSSTTDVSVPPSRTAQPLVDFLHFAPTKAWGKHPLSFKTAREIRALRRELHAADYSAVLDLQGSIKSAVVARLAGCRRIIGEAHPRESAARWFYTEHFAPHSTHVIERAIELAQEIAGDSLAASTPLLPVSPSAEQWCDSILVSDPTQKIILINPGAGWGAKCWPVERYSAIARSLIQDGCRVLINAGPGEEDLAEAIRTATSGAASPVLCSIEQLIALTRRVSLLIAGDTGPLHLACALGKPVVGIYGPTDPSRNGPYGTRFKVLRSPASKRDHTRRKETEAGLLTITVDNVMSAAYGLLNENPAEKK